MNQIEKQLKVIKEENRMGIMTHVVIGYPSLSENEKIIRLMINLGVDFIELQIPFSDPMADGSTIMNANKQALENKTKVKDAFVLMKKISDEFRTPLLFMGYFNTVLNYGTEKFCCEAALSGCSGLIFPDIPPEEESEENFIKYAEKYSLNIIRVLSPASTEERIKINSKIAKGFIYYVARKGITGVNSELDSLLIKNLENLKKFVEIPIAVGFGISTPRHIETLAGKTDLVVIGSAVLDVYNKAKKGEGLIEIEKLLKSLIENLKN